jgi:dipeptidyl aminopeptidase/acylaminoacyl peptidase
VTPRLLPTLLAALSISTAPALASPDAAAFERALDLREQWMWLTRGVADPARWVDAERFRYRRSLDGGFEFVLRRLDADTATPAFDHAQLADALADAGGGRHPPLRLPFSDYDDINDGGDGAVIRFRADAATWRCRIADRYACTRDDGEPAPRPRAWGVVRDLTAPADDRPRRSPDGRFEVFVRDGELRLREIESGAERMLASDASAEDFHDPESIVWSPDSRRLATLRVHAAERREVTRVEAAPRDRLQPRVHVQLYPKPGDPVDIERPVIFDIAHQRTIEVASDAFANPFRLSAPVFRADGRTLALRYVERGHQRVRLIEVDAASGAVRVVIDETSPSFVNDWWHRAFFHDIGNRGEEILWMSERDGWNHLYLVDGGSGEARQLTRGEWVVRQVLRVDEERREVWIAASGREPGDPYLQHVYRINLDDGELLHMTPARGWHDVALSPDLRHYVDTWSRVDQPTVSELRDARDGRLLAVLERGDDDALRAAGYRYPEPFVAPGRDGVTPIWGLIVRPTHFNPTRRYPVIENIYAGPHDAYVPKTFWPFGLHSSGDRVIGMQALAELGFIVVMIDGMGTMHRSKAFHDVAWRNLGDSGFPDRIAWHRALAARDPSYAIDRGVGIYGASAGGQSALGALLFHPEFYTAAVAFNGCYDNRMDKISWNEQWMGWPVDDEVWARASGVEHAHRLNGRLMMVVGEQDANVDPASTLQVVDALTRAGKDFDLVYIAGEGHGAGRVGPSLRYVQRRKFDFFVRHLLGVPTPDWNRVGS